MGPNFAPFRSTGHRYGDKRETQKSKMAAGSHLECDFYVQDVIDIRLLYPLGPNFHPFSLLRATVTEITCYTENRSAKIQDGGWRPSWISEDLQKQ